ncbi:DUF420 domain-containing protein [bacterium]|nr:DUF420 domain-containing protein [bacterium]
MEQKTNDKLVFRIVAAVTVFVFLVVLILKSGLISPSNPPEWIFNLPLLNALINGTCAILLILSLMAIRKKKIKVHKTLNITTFLLSALFLISYIVFHLFVPSTSFGGEGTIRTVYFIILISHIILAAIILPLILISFWFGLKMDVKRHKKVVRFTYPIWLYVAITGVVVYLMISPYYSF